tara:strand:+ start:311 stop:502 length:192 start_codon:yes stop_codon:yes gene_type:complete
MTADVLRIGDPALGRKAVQARIAKQFERLGLRDAEIDDYKALRKRGFPMPEAAEIIVKGRKTK